jgi:peptidoglycan-associated lipoprotein
MSESTLQRAAPPSADPQGAVLAIAPDIRAACGIAETNAFFAYNSARVAQADHALLVKLADCFTSGPLKGRPMQLVGHADPRGDSDYNYVLGQQRADRAKDAIVGAGMSGSKVSTTSRGENEAAGNDELSWSKDRKVEVLLGDSG